MNSATLRALLVMSSLLAGAGCANEEAHFDVRYAPEFAQRGVSSSIFGLFKDGRMSVDAWDEVAPKLLPSLGGRACELAYGSALAKTHRALADAVDDYARSNGVTDDLVAEFAPLAKGDTIMTFTMAGESSLRNDAGASSAPPMSQQPARARGGRSRRGMSSGPAPATRGPRQGAARGAFEVSVSLYSVPLHRSVAILSMTTSGPNVEEALDKFRRELEKELPGATCAGWNWDIEPDAERIRRLDEK